MVTKTKNKKEDEAKEEHYKFIRQLEIEDVLLHDAKIDTFVDTRISENYNVDIKAKGRYENTDSGFSAFQRYIALIRDEQIKEKSARISVTFKVSYKSRIPMNDKLFESFILNLHINTWPYFREFSHNMSIRMNIPPLIPPTFKGITTRRLT